MDADDIEERGLSLFLVGIYFYVVFSSLIAVIGWALQMAWILMMRLLGSPCDADCDKYVGHIMGMKVQNGIVVPNPNCFDRNKPPMPHGYGL